MADALVEGVTGQATAYGVPVAVHLVVTDATLFGTDNEPRPARLRPGAGRRARDLVRAAIERLGVQPAGWLRRVFTDPVSGDVTEMDSRTRRFCEGLDALIAVRDAGICRTPYCDAPIRDTDHVVPYDQGGRTNAANGQGLCEACNIAKQAPGWSAQPRPGPRHTVATTTPTGHTYDSTAPPLTKTNRTKARPHHVLLATRPSHRRSARMSLAIELDGKKLFDKETFGGNGRTCQTCHTKRTGTVTLEDVQRIIQKADPR